MNKLLHILFAGALILGLILVVRPSFAASEAQVVLKKGLTDVLESIKSPEYNNVQTRPQVRQKIAVQVKQHFDFVEFSSRTVGPRWREFSQEQQKQFSEAFADLLINTYVKKIDGYNGEQIACTGERVSSKGDRCEIMTVVTLKDGKKVPVNYRMLPKDGTWKVYDVLIENISLVKNYRTQFQDLFRSASVDEVITRIKAKALEVMNTNAQK